MTIGTENTDILTGNVQGEEFWGMGGNDLMRMNGGDDTAHGGDGNDHMTGDAGNDTLNGDEGRDYLFGGADNDALYGGDDIDYLDGGEGDDDLYGGAGNDVMRGGQGRDHYDGGEGFDTLDFSASTARVIVNLNSGTGMSGDAQGDTYTSIEGVNGGQGNDVLLGDWNDNVLRGGAGLDYIRGGGGDDVIEGGTNAAGYSTGDMLFGDSGADTFVFAPGDSGGSTKDVIYDFAPGEDKIGIDGDMAIFIGNWANGFLGSSGAQMYYLQDQDNGGNWTTTVYYRDGNGEAADLEIELLGQHDLTSSDFVYV